MYNIFKQNDQSNCPALCLNRMLFVCLFVFVCAVAHRKNCTGMQGSVVWYFKNRKPKVLQIQSHCQTLEYARTHMNIMYIYMLHGHPVTHARTQHTHTHTHTHTHNYMCLHTPINAPKCFCLLVCVQKINVIVLPPQKSEVNPSPKLPPEEKLRKQSVDLWSGPGPIPVQSYVAVYSLATNIKE